MSVFPASLMVTGVMISNLVQREQGQSACEKYPDVGGYSIVEGFSQYCWESQVFS